jgi:type I restriction enzyme S subunit
MKKENQWREVPLSEIAKPVTRPVQVVPGESYRTIGVKWWGEGAYERQTIDGSRTAAKTLSLVRHGDLIINKIWVRNGSTAIASRAVDGCAASGEFPTFELDLERVVPDWIHWQTKTPGFWAKCDVLSRGTSGKNRIKPELFLTIRVPLPLVAEQRRVLAHIDELAAHIQEAVNLREAAASDLDELCRSILRSDNHSELRPMRELVRLRPPDVTVLAQETYQFAGVYSFGRGVFRSQAKAGTEFAYPRLTRLRADNFVYPKLMAWEGALGIVPPDCDGCVVSTEFPVFELIEDRVLPEVLDTYFRTPTVWPELSGASTGTNVRRRRLNPADFLKYKIPLPSRAVQDELRQVKTAAKELERLQAETGAELDALLPSVLSKAFAGEL